MNGLHAEVTFQVIEGEGAIFFGGVDPEDLPPPGAPIRTTPIPSDDDAGNDIEPSRTREASEQTETTFKR